jgi:hypothetical protein
MTLTLGLGLALGWPRYRTTSVTAPYNEDSSYYRTPKNLEVISFDQLVNTKELALETNFVASTQPQIREYVFNITQALAAPDGFQKPMILVNGQSPGPLIEASTGDTSE